MKTSIPARAPLRARLKLACAVLTGTIIILTFADPMPAHAQSVTTFTTRSAFDAASTAQTTIDFEGTPTNSFNSTGDASLTVSGVTFTNSESRLFVYRPSSGSAQDTGSGQYLWNFDGGTPVGIFLPAGQTAFGADLSFSELPQVNGSFTATLYVLFAGGLTSTYAFPALESPGSTFFGFTSDLAINRIIFDGGSYNGLHEEILDNVTYGTAVPEPTSITLLLLTAGACVFWRAWRRNTAA